jgi:hypothetical protein
MPRRSLAVKKVSATSLRGKLKTYLNAATANRVVLVENRRQPSKYLVDKDFLDSLLAERDSILATLEILANSPAACWPSPKPLTATSPPAACSPPPASSAAPRAPAPGAKPNDPAAKTAFSLRPAIVLRAEF